MSDSVKIAETQVVLYIFADNALDSIPAISSDKAIEFQFTVTVTVYPKKILGNDRKHVGNQAFCCNYVVSLSLMERVGCWNIYEVMIIMTRDRIYLILKINRFFDE